MRRIGVLLLALWPATALAQATIPPAPAEVPAPPAAALGEALRTPGGAFAASLIVPGSGQAALGLNRWVAYGMLELAFWGVHLEAAADVRRLSRGYRDLAWEAARAPTGPAARVDGSWGYYETMSHFVTSGAFDADPGSAGVQPESDPGTYNGSVWDLAQGLFLGPGPVDPASEEYARALAYYQEQAAGPDFLWDWTSRPGALDRFRGLIQDADSEARTRSTALGLVLANHMVSAIDALVVARLRTGGAGVRLESRLRPVPGSYRWNIGLRLPIPN